jgi:hypothetical protein
MWQAHRIFRNLEWMKTHFSNSTSYLANRSGLALHNVPDSYPFRRSRKSPTKSQTYYNDRSSYTTIHTELVNLNMYPSVPVASSTFPLLARPHKRSNTQPDSYPGVLAQIRIPSRTRLAFQSAFLPENKCD